MTEAATMSAMRKRRRMSALPEARPMAGPCEKAPRVAGLRVLARPRGGAWCGRSCHACQPASGGRLHVVTRTWRSKATTRATMRGFLRMGSQGIFSTSTVRMAVSAFCAESADEHTSDTIMMTSTYCHE